MPVSTEARPSRETVLERAERRERIAERLLPVITRIQDDGGQWNYYHAAEEALSAAEAFMECADRRRDADLAEARS